MLLLCRNQSIDLQSKSVDWFLYYNGLRHERVKTKILFESLNFKAVFQIGHERSCQECSYESAKRL